MSPGPRSPEGTDAPEIAGSLAPDASSLSPVLRRSVLFRYLQISSFTNSSWMRTDALILLGELQTHSWSNASDTISFVKPWAQGTFSSQQWVHLQNIFRVFRSSFTRDIQEFAKMLSLECELSGWIQGRRHSVRMGMEVLLGEGMRLSAFSPSEDLHFCLAGPQFQASGHPLSFPSTVGPPCNPNPMELQLSGGCEVHPGNVSEHFLHVAYQGEYILSFQGTAWEPAPQAPQRVDLVIKVLNQDEGTKETVQWLLNDICPQYVNGLLETGKSELEKQVKPEAWLSSGPSPGPGRLLPVCHVSGFYPKPVWVMWMRGEQEQQGTQIGDILPNGDETWYLRATLDVAAGELAGLACRVKHSSLGGQDLVLYWGGSHTSVGLVILVVLACLVLFFVLILGFYWIRRHRFVKPWAQGTFSSQQWVHLQNIFRVFRSSFTRDIQEFAKMLSLECELSGWIQGRRHSVRMGMEVLLGEGMRLSAFSPSEDLHYCLAGPQFQASGHPLSFPSTVGPPCNPNPMELQLSGGCEVHPGNVSEHFLHVAYQGEYILSFQGTAWEPAPKAPKWVDLVIKVLNQDEGTKETVQWLLNDIFPKFLNGLLETGKSELEKQVKPKAWLSSGPSPGSGRLLLVCQVSGFYPKPVWVMWMRGEQEQQGTQRGDFLPNGDETWYLRATLDVAAGEEAGLACRVKHSSLGGQDLVLYWGGSHTSVGLVILVVLACLVLLFVLILGFYWIRRHRSYEDIL
ncbi:Hypothetical predicted protein [Marmota monax]|uniref:Ig-like domain-containing protein n=1 Tax=Marmota monax TaxID=9995 RepID=A0A5E4B9Q0_MARMO|nr:Hypothetical predicted protein [Marmota monax]